MTDSEHGTWDEPVRDLRSRKDAARAMGGADRLARHMAHGARHARQRVAMLCGANADVIDLIGGDPTTPLDGFVELGALTGALPADAFVAGVGTVDGQPVAIGAEDFTVAGGSIGAAAAAKRHRLVELAVQERIPLVMLLEGAGHRPPLPDDPPVYRRPNDLQAQAAASGLIPMAAGVFGPSAGHGALSAPLSDFVVMTSAAAIFTAGPPLVKAATGEDVTKEQLGGVDVATRSGLVHNAAVDDADAIAQIRRWLSYLPPNAWQHPARAPAPWPGERATHRVGEIVPFNPRVAYDMAAVIDEVVDTGSWFEVQPRFGMSLLTGFARLGGDVVAVVANQPRHLAGTIDADAADKATRFIGLADSFHVPLVFLTDNPGVLAGTVSERAGILRQAARMFAAQHAATVPKIQVTLRKAYGFGSSAMGMNPFDGQTLNLALPGVTFGAMPSRGADDATGADEAGRRALRDAESASGVRSAASLSVDDLIEPSQLRNALLAGLHISAHRRHGPTAPVAVIGTRR